MLASYYAVLASRCLQTPVQCEHDFRAASRCRDLIPDALKGRRFGILREAMGSHPDADASAERAAAAMKAAGAEVVDVKLRAVDANHPGAAAVFEEFLYEFKHGLNAYLIDSGAPHQSLDAL
jgi:amidase